MDAILADLVDNGDLRESCDSTTSTTCNNDQVSFKGILVEYMAWFLSITGRDNGTKYSNFIKLQADKVQVVRRAGTAISGMVPTLMGRFGRQLHLAPLSLLELRVAKSYYTSNGLNHRP